MVTLYQHVTIDDDLYGKRAEDNLVKMLGHRKAVAERHVAYFIADFFHKILFEDRSRRMRRSNNSLLQWRCIDWLKRKIRSPKILFL